MSDIELAKEAGIIHTGEKGLLTSPYKSCRIMGVDTKIPDDGYGPKGLGVVPLKIGRA